MKTTSIIFIASFLFFLTSNINAELYMWVDENGVKHYSDTGPDEDATFEERGEYELEDPKKETIEDRAQRLKEQRAERARQRKKLYKKTRPKPRKEYELSNVTVYSKGENYIEVNGRVTGRESCARLRVQIFLYSDKGGVAHVVGIVKSAGGARTGLFRSRDYVYGHARDDWEVSRSYINCVSG